MIFCFINSSTGEKEIKYLKSVLKKSKVLLSLIYYIVIWREPLVKIWPLLLDDQINIGVHGKSYMIQSEKFSRILISAYCWPWHLIAC